MRIAEIKQKMIAWRDWYGQDIVQTDEIKKARTRRSLCVILLEHQRFLFDQNDDAIRNVDDFIKELGLDDI